MSYECQNFKDGQVLNAECMNKLDQAVVDAHKALPPKCESTDGSKVLSNGPAGPEWIDMPAVPQPLHLVSWEIVQSSDAVTLNYTLEDGSEHTDVIAFDANGYPVSITHDGVTAEGTWTEGQQ